MLGLSNDAVFDLTRDMMDCACCKVHSSRAHKINARD